MAIPARKPGQIARLNRAEIDRTGTIWTSLLQEEGIARDIVGGQDIIAPGGSAIREPGRVAIFNGSQASRVAVPLPGTNFGSYLIAARIRATGSQGGDPGQAFGITYSAGNQGSTGVGFNSASNSVGQTWLHSNGAGLGSSRAATVGTWYTVYAQAALFIGTSMRAWVDGAPCTPVAGAGVPGTPDSITIGAQHRGAGYLRNFTGEIEWAAVLYQPSVDWMTDDIAAELFDAGYPYNLIAKTKIRRIEPAAGPAFKPHWARNTNTVISSGITR